MRFAYAFNCTGPLHSIARTQGSAAPQPARCRRRSGPTISASASRSTNAARAGEHLWALGPLTKGRYWEIIAVPDIREQAAAVADDIARELGR